MKMNGRDSVKYLWSVSQLIYLIMTYVWSRHSCRVALQHEDHLQLDKCLHVLTHLLKSESSSAAQNACVCVCRRSKQQPSYISCAEIKAQRKSSFLTFRWVLDKIFLIQGNIAAFSGAFNHIVSLCLLWDVITAQNAIQFLSLILLNKTLIEMLITKLFLPSWS